ncbi:MAG: hypothetical protein AAFW73_06835 [Bacteroidota bacterium]
MQKKIALIEPYRHSEVLRSLIHLLDHRGWRVSIFTNPTVRADLYEVHDHPRLRWWVGDTQAPAVFLQGHLPQLAEQDLLLFVTLVTDFNRLSRIDWPAPSILILHNGHTFFAPWQHLRFPRRGRDWLRLLRMLLRGEPRRRQRLLASVDFLSGPSPHIQADWCRRWPQLLERYQWVSPLPFAFYEGPGVERTDSRLRVVIPGTVNPAGRDYQLLYRALQRILPDLQQPLDLFLLGSARSTAARRVVQSFESLSSPLLTCHYFPDVLAQVDFDRHLRSADFLLLPLRSHYPLGLIRERYGYSNISGGLNDALRFGLPLLLPAHYPVPDAVRPLVRSYRGEEDLVNTLRSWLLERDFLLLRQDAPTQLAPYSLDPLSAQLDRELRAILSR